MYAIERNMWIGVAASEEDSSAGELTCVVARRALRADKAAAQPDEAAIAARVPCRVFEAQAGPLRKSEQHDAVRLEALGADPVQQAIEHVQRRRQEWLVANDRGKKRIWIPAPAGRLRR